MNSDYFSKNLRRLRLEKHLTQEQLAVMLGVSVQSVSRWECGNTLPDVMLLPQIARLYGVTVDDLYREDAKGYANYASRLLSVYEASGRPEDYLAAEQEFARMPENSLTADDLRGWGVLHHYMMKHSAAQALQRLEQAMLHPEASEQIRNSAAQQKIALLCDLGKGHEEAARYDRELENSPAEPQLWLLCTAAHALAGENEQALDVAVRAMAHFPDSAAFCYYAGESCQALKRYDEAFSWWEKSLELDSDFHDAMYSMGFCYEELGQYDNAYKVWIKLVKELDQRGLVIEREFPAKQARNCLNRIT